MTTQAEPMTTVSEETSEALIGEVLAAETHEIRELYVPNGLDIFINRIRVEVKKHDPDISTERGRKAIASLALKVAKSKVRLDDIGKEAGAEAKATLDGILAERKRMRDILDALKDEVRKPLTDWENAETARQDAHLGALAQIQELSSVPIGASADEIRERIVSIEAFSSREWEEFQKRGDLGMQAALLSLNRLLGQTIKHEEELAQIEEFKKQQAARAQAEREEAMKAEAAAKATAAAEAQAARQAQETAAAESRQREEVERQRIAAEERATAAERETARVAAQAIADQAAAVERERARASEEKRIAEEAEAKREANKRHCAKINRAIVAALMAVEGVGLTEDHAMTLVAAMAKGLIPNVKITY